MDRRTPRVTWPYTRLPSPRLFRSRPGMLSLGLAHAARGRADLLVDLAQLPAGVTAPAFDLAPLGGDFLQFAIDLFQLALRVAGALCLHRRRHQHRDEHDRDERADPARLGPPEADQEQGREDRKSTRLNSSH